MIINDYSQYQETARTDYKELLYAGAIVILPVLFLLIISAH